jgi:alpha-D-ribose 1-methylphosphonate 5-triphosphate synthase subunit PhnH
MNELAAGFADPPHDAQRLFRAILDAISRPGRIAELADAPVGPDGVSTGAAGCLLTLADRDTPLWLAPAFNQDAIRDFFRFHTGAPVVAERNQASFALLGRDIADLEGFAIGTDTYPDRSATLVIEVPALEGEPARTWRGPGIAGTSRVAIAGLPDAFWQAWTENHALFPCGVDILFVAGHRLVALPRSIAVEA